MEFIDLKLMYCMPHLMINTFTQIYIIILKYIVFLKMKTSIMAPVSFDQSTPINDRHRDESHHV